MHFAERVKTNKKLNINQNNKPSTIISSYLVTSALKNKAIVSPTPIDSTNQPIAVSTTEPIHERSNHQQYDHQGNSKNITPTSKPLTPLADKPNSSQRQVTPNANSISGTQSDRAQTTTRNKENQSSKQINKEIPNMSLVRDYLNNKVAPPASWEQHQQEQQNQTWHAQQKRQVMKKFKGKFVPDIPGMKDLGKLGDGSQLIKQDGSCYAIKRDQFGDSLWLNTPCPLSSNPLRKAYRKSMSKYLKK